MGARRWMLAGLASRGRRLISAAVAVVIGTAFLAATLSLIDTAARGVQDSVAAGLRDVDLVLTGADGALLTSSDVAAATGVPGVAGVAGQAEVYLQAGREILVGGTSPDPGAVLVEGRLPQSADEIAVNRSARSAGMGMGEALRLSGMAPADAGADPPAVEVVVVGVVDPAPGSRLNMGPSFLGTDNMLRQVDPNLSYTALHLHLHNGADVAQVRAGLLEAVPGAWQYTGLERAEAAVEATTGGADFMTALAAGFAAVALGTAAIVIANTFTITLAQRQRELALLRCVGASTNQVRRQVLIEALVLGAIASAFGVLLGLATSAALLAVARRTGFEVIPTGTALAVTPAAVLIPLVAGGLVTVLAGLWPAVRATRVAPLQAMRPATPALGQNVPQLRRLLAGGTVFALGVALMAVGAALPDPNAGILGGFISFVGVMIATVVLIPASMRLLGALPARVGVPGRLAVDNAVRQTGRAAATGTALLVGVTLITTTSVGAATAERTVMGEIDDAYAVDLLATAPDDLTSPGGAPRLEALDPALTNTIAAVDGVAATRAVPSTILGMGEWEDPILTIGVDTDSADVVRSTTQLASLEPGTLGMGNVTQAIHGIGVGEQVTMNGPSGTRKLRVVEFGLGEGVVAVNDEDLAALGGDQVRRSVLLVGLDDDANPVQVLDDLQQVAQPAGVVIDGPAVERAGIVQILDVLVLLATALLAVAVIIAIVGIANTLSLSVIERHHEHSLLRALGLTRKQLRLMLLTEGALLAVVSSLIGVALGVLYGRLGAQTMLPEQVQTQLAVPALRMALILAAALAAGLLASVLPARRAANTPPAQGLATG